MKLVSLCFLDKGTINAEGTQMLVQSTTGPDKVLKQFFPLPLSMEMEIAKHGRGLIYLRNYRSCLLLYKYVLIF